MAWKWIVVRIFFAVVVLPAGVIGSLWVLNQRGFFAVDQIEIEIADSGQKVTHLKSQLEHLNQQIEKYRGQSLWSMNLQKISEELSAQNWIEDSHLVRVWPSTLRLSIKPQMVQMVYRNPSGDFFPVVKSGSLLDPISATQSPDVVLLTGDVFQKKIELRKKAIDVISQIPDQGNFSRKTIAEMSYDSKEGFWVDLMKSNLRVKMGEDNIAQKSQRISQVVEYLNSHQFEARVIDANLSQKVLVRLRKDP